MDKDLRLKVAKKARVRWDEREQCHFLLYPERGLRLNETAHAIVSLCDGTRTVGAIIDELARAHEDTPRERIEGEVLSFLEEMRRRALLEIA